MDFADLCIEILKTAHWDDASALGRLTRWLLLLMALLLIGTCIAWLYNSIIFPSNKVSHTGQTDLFGREGTSTCRSTAHAQQYFPCRFGRYSGNLSKLPWVNSAMVRRRFPDTVEIHLTERVPVAHWRSGGLVDSKAMCLTPSSKPSCQSLKDNRVRAKTWSNTTKNFRHPPPAKSGD